MLCLSNGNRIVDYPTSGLTTKETHKRNEPRHEKANNLKMRKQRRRSASR